MKSKTALFVFADTESFEGLGRVFNALQAAKELKEAGDDVKLVFDGAGTKWVGALSKPDHKAHGLFMMVKDRVVGACSFCAGVFGAAEEVKRCEIRLADEYEGHPSVKKLLDEGYRIINF